MRDRVGERKGGQAGEFYLELADLRDVSDHLSRRLIRRIMDLEKNRCEFVIIV